MQRVLVFCVFILLILSVGCTLNRPEISEESLKGSAQIIEAFEEIEEADVFIENGKISFYIVPTVDKEVTQERSRELGRDFLKVLSGYTVNEELQGPTDESYGEIYDYYDVEIIVEGKREILDRGKKDKGDAEIEWQK